MSGTETRDGKKSYDAGPHSKEMIKYAAPLVQSRRMLMDRQAQQAFRHDARHVDDGELGWIDRDDVVCWNALRAIKDWQYCQVVELSQRHQYIRRGCSSRLP